MQTSSTAQTDSDFCLNILLADIVLRVGTLALLVLGSTGVASEPWVVLWGTWNLTSELLESLALGLWDQQGSEDTEQHEEREDLENVVQPWRCVGGGDMSAGTERSDGGLGDDGTDLSRGGRETVGGRSVAGWEALSRNNESGGVWTEVEEELGKDVAGKETVSSNDVVTETHDTEDDGEDGETHQLNWLTTDSVDKSDGDPVTWNGTSADNDNVTDSGVVEDLVDVSSTRVADSLKNDSVVEGDTVESNIEEEPRTSSSEKDLSVLPLAVVAPEVAEGTLWNGKLVGVVADGLDTGNLIWNTLWLVVEVRLDVGASLDDIARDIKGVTRSLWDGKTVVESDATWNGTHSDDDTPHLVDGKTADTTTVGNRRTALERLPETSSDDESNDTGTELTKTLHGEDGTHHGTSPAGSSELGGNDRGKWVVTTDTNTHENTPEDNDTDNGDGWRGRSESLGESCEDDEDKLETVHALTTDLVSSPTETELTDDGTTRGSDLDGSVGVGRDLSWVLLGVLPVDDTKHVGHETNGEDVVGIGEETGTGDEDGANVVPTELGLVNLSKSKTSALVWVGDVCVVVVKVVEGGVTTGSPDLGGVVSGGHCYCVSWSRVRIVVCLRQLYTESSTTKKEVECRRVRERMNCCVSLAVSRGADVEGFINVYVARLR